jgi:LysM repeat protein
MASFAIQINPVAAQTNTTDCGQSYIVRSGDTLREIAIKCDVTVSEIVTYNDFIDDPDLIIPGWILDLTKDQSDTVLIPETGAAATSSGYYVVKAGDTLPYIAQRLDLNENDLLVSNPQLNEDSELYTGQILMLPGALDEPAAAVSPRVIEPGQNVTVVARGFEKNSEVLVAGGPLGEVEQVLKVMDVNGDGALRTTINVPANADRGQRWSFIVRAIVIKKKKITLGRG